MTVIPFARVLRCAPPGSAIPGPEIERLRGPLTRLVGKRYAARIFEKTGTVGALRMPADELAAATDIPQHIAERVVAAREFGFAAAHPHPPKLCSSADVVAALPEGFAEALLAFALTGTLEVKATIFLARGGCLSTSVKPRDVFVPLSRFAATAFICAHNHPSGSVEPSTEDIHLTLRLRDLGATIGIELLDHVIVTATRSASFLDLGLLAQSASAAA
jgi:DNA repair protein RadC